MRPTMRTEHRKDVSMYVRYAPRGLGRISFSKESLHFGGEFQLLLQVRVHCDVGVVDRNWDIVEPISFVKYFVKQKGKVGKKIIVVGALKRPVYIPGTT